MESYDPRIAWMHVQLWHCAAYSRPIINNKNNNNNTWGNVYGAVIMIQVIATNKSAKCRDGLCLGDTFLLCTKY